MNQDKNTNNGIRICEHASYGRVMEADRVFAVGEEVLSEEPFVTFQNPQDLIGKVLLMNNDERDIIFDFHHLKTFKGEGVAPECQATCRLMWADAENYAATSPEKESPTFFFEILTIAAMNSHKFYGQKLAFTDIVGGGGKEGSCSALFRLGSKVTHSCSPNCMYSSKRKPGHGDYIAIQPILKGDLITFNYLSALLISTEARRDKLLREKNFFCVCSKCIRPDYTRGIVCDKCEAIAPASQLQLEKASLSPSVKLCLQEDVTSSPLWTCLHCGDNGVPRNLKHERTFDNWLILFKAKVAKGVQPQHVTEIRTQIEAAEKLLCRTHHLVLELYSELSMVAASAAACLEQLAPKLSEMNRLDSMAASCDFIQIVECMAAECLCGVGCTTSHPPQVDAIQQVLWSCMDAQKSGSECLTRMRCIDIGAKYRSLLMNTFGKQDKDVLSILRMIHQQQQQRSAFSSAAKLSTTSFCANPICVESNCGNSPLLKCSRCLAVSYCCGASQKAHWKVHKKTCKQQQK